MTPSSDHSSQCLLQSYSECVLAHKSKSSAECVVSLRWSLSSSTIICLEVTACQLHKRPWWKGRTTGVNGVTGWEKKNIYHFMALADPLELGLRGSRRKAISQAVWFGSCRLVSAHKIYTLLFQVLLWWSGKSMNAAVVERRDLFGLKRLTGLHERIVH